jgi:hypothetical protein
MTAEMAATYGLHGLRVAGNNGVVKGGLGSDVAVAQGG